MKYFCSVIIYFSQTYHTLAQCDLDSQSGIMDEKYPELTWHFCKPLHNLPSPEKEGDLGYPLTQYLSLEFWYYQIQLRRAQPCNNKTLNIITNFITCFKVSTDLFGPPLGFLLLFMFSWSKLPSMAAWRVGTGIVAFLRRYSDT